MVDIFLIVLSGGAICCSGGHGQVGPGASGDGNGDEGAWYG